ncbi:MAG: EAL domain-containing response regulator [Gemmatimonadaceae bacterium]
MTEILLLDDDPLQLKLLARQLNGAGYEDVVGCTNASDALKALTDPAQSIGLIFLDLNMPGVDGVAFLRLLAEQQCAAAVVLVSGEDERLVETAVRLGESHHLNVLGALPKPVWTAELRALLSRWSSAAETPPTTSRVYSPDEVLGAITRGELVNYYQPVVSVETGAVVGVEALVRWQHPQDGLVLPGAFVDLAEAHGFINELTRSVIKEALSHAGAWREAGHMLSMAINVYMGNLDHLDFFDRLLAEADDNRVPAASIVLEISESHLARATRSSMEIVSRLRLKRVTMCIDDFGLGQASLAQLRDLPFNEIKVDGSFVHGACTSATLDVILASSLKMAKHLGMRTVAEGVEDRSDWDWLRDRGCDHAQGYFIGRPMPGADLPRWIVEWDKRKQELFRR